MSRAVNILGDTPKQQWMNAISIFEMCIEGNVRISRDEIRDSFGYEPEEGERVFEQLDIAMRNTKLFADEMRRLVEGVFE